MTSLLRFWYSGIEKLIRAFGWILTVGGLLAGLYAGFWWAFVGGIVLIIESAKDTPIYSMGIAFGLLRVCFTAFIGWFTFFVISGIGFHLAGYKSKHLTREDRMKRWGLS